MTKLVNLDDAALLDWAKAFRALAVSTTIAKERTFTATMGEFPAEAVERYLRHGFQRLHNDAVGGKDKFATTAAKMEYVEKHIADMMNGIVGRQSAGEGATPEVTRARVNLRKVLRQKLSADDYKARFTTPDAADQIKALDAILAANPDLVEEAKRELAAEKAKAESLDLSALGL